MDTVVREQAKPPELKIRRRPVYLTLFFRLIGFLMVRSVFFVPLVCPKVKQD